ncbi:MAG: type II secretion system protein GspL [Amphiplicatus sp.]
MAETLILLLGTSPKAPIRWGRFENGRLIAGGVADNADALDALADDGAARLIALLPGEQVAARRAPSLPQSGAKARDAARYLMEDELAEAASQLHVAVSPLTSPGQSGGLAFAVKSAIIETWLSAFSLAGLDCAILSADYLALPSSDEEATALFEDGRAVVAFDGAGFALDAELFAALAPRLFDPAPARIMALGDPSARRLLPQDSLVDGASPAEPAGALVRYAAAIAEKEPPNFLQGPYQKKRALTPLLAPWRRAGLIAAAIAGVFCLGLVAEAIRAEGAARAWTEAAADIHRQRFPDAAGADPADHARQILARDKAGTSFLTLAARFTEALQNTDKIEIERIRFNAARGEFVVSVSSADDAGIEEFKTSLAGLGVTTQDSGGYRRSGEAWTGELSARLQ